MKSHIDTSTVLYFGSSPAIEKVKWLINTAAETNCSVLLLGASGTGKGMIARWIHDHSCRKSGEFVGINSSGLSNSLLKSELFGHMKGSFTSASNEHPGLIETADGGTLFLDEIGNMDLGVQAQLLNAMEEKIYRRLGGNDVRRSDFRLICATNRNLLEATKNGGFREDFYHRINTLPIMIPPLSERKEDIPGLTCHILASFGYDLFPIDKKIVNALRKHYWRGNIRELRNVLERALIFARKEVLTIEHVTRAFGIDNQTLAKDNSISRQHDTTAIPENQQRDHWDLKSFEEAHIMRALKHHGGNKIKTAEALSISLSSLYRKLEKARQQGGRAWSCTCLRGVPKTELPFNAV